MDNIYENIFEGYFANKLSASDKAEFDRLVKEDPAFAKEFAWRLSLAAATRNGTAQSPAKLQLQDLENQFQQRRITNRLMIAALLLGLLSAIGWFALKRDITPPPPQETPTNTLPNTPAAPATPSTVPGTDSQDTPKPAPAKVRRDIAGYFKPYDVLSQHNTMGAVQSADSLADLAYTAYSEAAFEAGKYRDAVRLFQATLAANPADAKMEHRFYLGVSAVATQDFALAIAQLTKVQKAPGKFQEPALFYLGLAYAGDGQQERAAEKLQRYVAISKDPDLKASAKALLEKLK